MERLKFPRRSPESSNVKGSLSYNYNTLGRWTSSDPLGGNTGDPQSLNRYAYVQNDPVNYTDPSGLYLGDIFEQWWFWGWGDRVGDLPGYGSRIGENTRYQEWRHDLIITLGFDPSFPDRRERGSQKPISEQKYNECAKLLGNSPVMSYSQAVAIVGTSDLEGTDATLIAVTWAAEAIPAFNFYPVSNPRDDGGADVGPMQTATTVYNKAPFTDGLTNPFGTTRSDTEPFNGNPYQNLLLGARALNDAYGQTRRGEDRRAVAVGIYRAGSRTGTGYSDRVKQFNKWKGNKKKGYDAFFNCLRS